MPVASYNKKYKRVGITINKNGDIIKKYIKIN